MEQDQQKKRWILKQKTSRSFLFLHPAKSDHFILYPTSNHIITTHLLKEQRHPIEMEEKKLTIVSDKSFMVR